MPEVRLIDANVLIKDIVESIHLADKWEIESHEKKDECGLKHAIATRQSLMAMLSRVKEFPTIEAEPVRHGRWLNTDETVWDAKDIDGKQQLEISIVSARCSVCNHWAEQVNNFPPYMEYELCPHCGAKMDGGAYNG